MIYWLGMNSKNRIIAGYVFKPISMKKYIVILSALGLLFSCNPENNPNGSEGQDPEKIIPKELIVTAEASEINYTSATLYGYANIPEGMTGVTFGIIISVDKTPAVDNGTVIQSNELDSNNKFYCKITDLRYGTTFYYKAYLKEGDFYHTDSKTLSFSTKDFVASGQEPVDMGLNVKWGSCNIGASDSFEYGDFYTWGETEPYGDHSYKWGYPATKYTSTDKKSTLELTDDIAHVKLGGNWRMPTLEEWSELRNSCTWTWINLVGLKGGCLVTGPSGNCIFFPASYKNSGYLGLYWSSTRADNYDYAFYMYFSSDEFSMRSERRSNGYSIRPVCTIN